MKMLAASTIALVLFLAACRPAASLGQDVSTLSPQQVEQKALEHLAAGRQSQAEHLLEAYAAGFPEILRIISVPAQWQRSTKVLQAELKPYRAQQRAFFLLAACTRSRFAIEDARPLFIVVNNMDPSTPAGKCAAMVLILDNSRSAGLLQRIRVSEVFAILVKFPDAYPDDVAIRWMAAVQCRQAHMNTDGAEHFRKILDKWRPGPILVHQTYANVLDELKRYSEALPERRKAVEMEPAGWSYDGLATTLYNLERFEEANEAHAKAVQMDPGCALFVTKWARTLMAQERYDAAIAKGKQAIDLEPETFDGWWVWAKCLEAQGKKAEALEKYQKVVELNKLFLPAHFRIAALTKELEKPKKAAEKKK